MEEREDALLDQIESVRQNKKESLKSQLENLEINLSSILNTCEFTETVLREGNDIEVLALKSSMANRLKELTTSKVDGEPHSDDSVYRV